jgi:putative alpha-1,2-mannosidase
MSSWFVFNAMGFYTFSPADPSYIVTVPLFDKITLKLGDKTTTIVKKGHGRKITDISWTGKKVKGYFISDADLKKGQTLTISTQ